MKYKPKTSQHTTPAYVENSRVAILRNGHGREGATFTTQVSYIVTSDGARLLAGRAVTAKAFDALVRDAENHERTASNVRPFPQRPRPTSPTNTHNRRAA